MLCDPIAGGGAPFAKELRHVPEGTLVEEGNFRMSAVVAGKPLHDDPSGPSGPDRNGYQHQAGSDRPLRSAIRVVL